MAEIKDRLLALMAEQLGVTHGSVMLQATWEQLGLDSLDKVDLVMAVEDAFNIQIDDKEAEAATTVGDAVLLVEGTIARSTKMAVKAKPETADFARLERKAVEIAELAHAGQTRRQGGVPYITHPLAVRDLLVNKKVDGVETLSYPLSERDWCIAKIAAVCHDVFEDAWRSLPPDDQAAKVYFAGFFGPAGSLSDESLGVVNAACLLLKQHLTHQPNDTYAAYLERVADSWLATLIKLADLQHNLSDLPAATSARDKYELAKMYLLQRHHL